MSNLVTYANWTQPPTAKAWLVRKAAQWQFWRTAPFLPDCLGRAPNGHPTWGVLLRHLRRHSLPFPFPLLPKRVSYKPNKTFLGMWKKQILFQDQLMYICHTCCMLTGNYFRFKNESEKFIQIKRKREGKGVGVRGLHRGPLHSVVLHDFVSRTKKKNNNNNNGSWLIYLEHILMIPLATYWLQIVKSNNIQYKQYIKCVCISEQVGLQSKLNFAQYWFPCIWHVITQNLS